MLGSGYFNPLTGYMNIAEAMSVAENMTTPDGLFWPVPIMNIVEEDQLSTTVRNASRLALRDPNVDDNPVLAIMDVSEIEVLTDAQKGTLIEHTFRTADPEHPGVAAFNDMGDQVISGQIEVLNYSYFKSDFADTFRTASEIRDIIREELEGGFAAVDKRFDRLEAEFGEFKQIVRDVQTTQRDMLKLMAGDERWKGVSS